MTTIDNTARTSDTSPSRTLRRRLTAVPVGVVAVAALLAGGITTEIYAVAARAVGVDFVAGSFGNEPAEIPAFGFFWGVLIEGAIGIPLAMGLARWAKRPRYTWNVTTCTLTALSVAAPFTAEASTGTHLGLVVSHLVAAAVVIPIIASRLAPTNPRRTNPTPEPAAA